MVLWNYYALLGVRPDASGAEIRRAFRECVLRHHPDLHPNDARVEEHFRAIVAAYVVLSDPATRIIYDQQIAGPVKYDSELAELIAL